MVRKEYSAPVVQTENVVLGVFGIYNYKGTGKSYKKDWKDVVCGGSSGKPKKHHY